MSINKWPFYPETIIEIMGPTDKDEVLAKNVLTHFLSGCAVNLKRSLSIVGFHEKGIDQVSKLRDRVDIISWRSFNYSKLCEYFRHEGENTGKFACDGGEERCIAWDDYNAQEILNKVKKEKLKNHVEIFKCHLNLIDVASVIYVASNPVGLLYAGQYIDSENIGKARQEIEDAINNLDSLNQEPPLNLLPKVILSQETKEILINRIDLLDKLTDKDELKRQIRKEAEAIEKNAEEYWIRFKRAKENELLKILYEIQKSKGEIRDQKALSICLNQILKEVAEFLGIKWIAFFADWEGNSNILDFISSYGMEENITVAKIHFNCNKSGIEFEKLETGFHKNNEPGEFLKKGLRQRNEKITNMLNQFETCAYLIPSYRGTLPEKTVIMMGSIEEKIQYELESDFLVSLCNFIADDFRHDNRHIRLIQKENERSEINDFISHQVRSVLHPIRSGVNIIIKKLNGSEWITQEEAQFYAQNVQNHIKHLSEYSKKTLSGEVRSWEKIGIYKKEEFIKQDISFYLSKIIDGYKETARAKNVDIKKGPGFSSNIEMEIVIEHFETAVRNIIDNAIKYSTPNKYIKIDIQNDFGLWAFAEKVKITIQNIGYGIKPNEINKIFNKGFRGSNSEIEIGDGLGLYEAKKIMLGHQGDIQCLSDKRNNKSTKDDWLTIFILTIPFKKQSRSR